MSSENNTTAPVASSSLPQSRPKDVAIRKRTQIAKANRTMFVWVAVTSVIFGFALVATIFLAQMLIYNEKVIYTKNQTVKTLDSDNSNIAKLESQVRVLNTNQALINAKANPGDQAVQVILDALPSDANSLALGSSLQFKLLAGIPGLTLNSLQVDPVVGVESTAGSDLVTDNSMTVNSPSDYMINFRFSVSGDDNALKQVLSNLERSIRTIDVTSMKIESQGSSRSLSVEARAYYEPMRVVELKDKVVKQ
jgi:cell division protein FtsL